MTGRGNGSWGLLLTTLKLSVLGEKRGREKGEVGLLDIALLASEATVVLGNKETSVTGIKDFPDPTGLKPRGSSGSSD